VGEAEEITPTDIWVVSVGEGSRWQVWKELMETWVGCVEKAGDVRIDDCEEGMIIER
jgi:hypothetical protein